jgi:NADPH:quinone reductase-like Zn-dependent oxidoreductase
MMAWVKVAISAAEVESHRPLALKWCKCRTARPADRTVLRQEPRFMKAIVMTAIGGPEVLQVADLPKPAAGPNRVLVRVHAAGVNPIDYKLRKTGALGAKAGTVLGFDVAGVIESVGVGVTDLAPGDEVYYSPAFGAPGGYAEYHVADAALVARKPRMLSFEQAAAIPVAGMTAWDGVVTRGQVGLGQTVLVTAAAGGVGSLALQICKAAGAYVFATASARSLDFVKQLGPDRVIDYQSEDFAQVVAAAAPAGLDLVYDCVGQDVVSRALALMKPACAGREGGRIVTIVNPSGQFAEAYRRNVAIHFEFLQRRRATLDILATLLERGQIRPRIDRVLPLEQAAEAQRLLEGGGIQGKIVLRVA